MQPDSTTKRSATLETLWRQEWEQDQCLLPSNPPNCSNSRSESPQSQPRRPCSSSSTDTPINFIRLECPDGSVLLFKEPECTMYSEDELPIIRIDTHLNIPEESTDSVIQRDIINPKDVVIKRREGEGSKPIFDREEIKARNQITQAEEVEQSPADVTVNNDASGGNSEVLNIGNQSHCHRRKLSRHFRDARSYGNYRYSGQRNISGAQRVSPPHYNDYILCPDYCSHFPPIPRMEYNNYSPMTGPSRPDFSSSLMNPYIHRF